jgi:insulysin
VVLAIFNYIVLFRSSPFEAYHFEERRQMTATRFRFSEKSQPHTDVRKISLDLLNPLDPEDILSGGALSQSWDEKAVRELLDVLRPEKARVMIMAQEHDSSINDEAEPWSMEKWYGTVYKVQSMSQAFIDQVS